MSDETEESERPPEALFNVNRLSILSGLDRRTVEKRLLPLNKKSFTLAESLPLLCKDAELAETEKEIVRNRARQSLADARNSEMEADEREGKLMLAADCEALWSDGLTRIRQAITGAKFIPQPMRDRLIKEVVAIKLEGE